MRAQAPGKLVLSGAYSVLEGAPALVAAVDRYVVADDALDAPLETEEVKAAVARGFMSHAVGFDASALRKDDRKLGLGSSAAILVASMAVCSSVPDDALAATLFEPALTAHRAAQGGGSGVDVAAACFGGVLRCVLAGDVLDATPHTMPGDLGISCWACPGAASTRDMLARVRQLAARAPDVYAQIIARARAGAEACVAARDSGALIAAIGAQREALGDLGEQAGVPIVTAEVGELATFASAHGASFAPSGAGGGDVALLFHPEGEAELLAEFRSRAVQAGLIHVPMQVGARGVHRL